MKQHPSSLKYRKYHKPGSIFLHAQEQKNFYPMQGTYALLSLQASRVNGKQIEAGRKSIRRSVHKSGKIFIRLFTNLSITKRAVGMRMGKGKGNHHVWVCAVRRGHVIYELKGIKHIHAMRALKLAGDKLPFKCKAIRLSY